jgi:hypothetical protein
MTTPFYLDWTFWSFVVASLALLLSQLPPIKQMLKNNKIEVELYEIGVLTHTLGNPNFTLHISINNIGSNELKVNSINCLFEHSEGDKFATKAITYFETTNDQNSLLLPTFKIEAEKSWSHPVLFFNRFNRSDDKKYREITANLKRNIINKRLTLNNINVDVDVDADPDIVAPVIAFYDSQKKWKAGEYSVTLSVTTEPSDASISQQFRFTLYESDIEQLESYKEQYKIGLGVFFYNSNEQQPVTVPIIQV